MNLGEILVSTARTAPKSSEKWLQIIEVLSGACQPLLMYEIHSAGLGDSRCQLYMVTWPFFRQRSQQFLQIEVPYYLGMSCTGVLHFWGKSEQVSSWKALMPSMLVALWGITAQSLNWAGNMRATRQRSAVTTDGQLMGSYGQLTQLTKMTKAGSSIFAVVYASVTIWSALLSRLLLQQLALVGSLYGLAVGCHQISGAA